MNTKMRIFKSDKSVVVRLVNALVNKLGLKKVIAAEIKEDRRRRALERLASRNWTLPPDYKFDRGEANGR
jgi:antitoxin MazE